MREWLKSLGIIGIVFSLPIVGALLFVFVIVSGCVGNE